MFPIPVLIILKGNLHTTIHVTACRITAIVDIRIRRACISRFTCILSRRLCISGRTFRCHPHDILQITNQCILIIRIRIDIFTKVNIRILLISGCGCLSKCAARLHIGCWARILCRMIPDKYCLPYVCCRIFSRKCIFSTFRNIFCDLTVQIRIYILIIAIITILVIILSLNIFLCCPGRLRIL